MRINFGSTYKEVQQLLQASAKPAAPVDEAAFAKSLGDLLLQPVDSSEQKPPSLSNVTSLQSFKSSIDEVKASYRFHDPELLMPDMAPIIPPQTEAIPSENSGGGVKTPTLLEARRVTLEPARMMTELHPTPSALEGLANTDPLKVQTAAPQSSSAPTSDVAKVVAPKPLKIDLQSPSTSEVAITAPQLNQRELLARLSQASQKFGLDPALAKAVVHTESGFNVTAVSNDGHNSKGLFQLLDSTGKTLLARAENPDGEYDPFDPDLNIHLGTSYLRYLHDIFKTPTQLPGALATKAAANDESLEQLAVAAFNAGEGRVASAQERSERAGRDPAHYDNVAPFLPRSTREYVARVVRGKRLF